MTIGADLPDHHGASLHADPDGKSPIEPFHRQLGNRREDIEPGADRAQRVVLVRLGRAEERQEPVSQDLSDRSAVVLDHAPEPRVDLPDDIAPGLGVESFGHPRRTDHVGEEDLVGRR